jgi:hypothetical protein
VTRKQNRLVNAGYSLAAAQYLANQRYGPAAIVGGNWSIRKDSGNAAKGRYQSTTRVPNKGEFKKASLDEVEVPAYIRLAGPESVSNFRRMLAESGHIRSASSSDQEYLKAMCSPDMVACSVS